MVYLTVGILTCLSMRRVLSSLENSVSHSTQTAPYTHARRNSLLFEKRQRGIFGLHWVVQIHSGLPVVLVLFRKDQLARMNGTLQPNHKWLPAQGIEPGSLNHKPQPLTIGPFLTRDNDLTDFVLVKGENTAKLQRCNTLLWEGCTTQPVWQYLLGTFTSP